MKNLNSKTIAKAIKLGFDFSKIFENEDFDFIKRQICDFLRDNLEKLPIKKDYCEVTTSGRNQHVSYGDFESDGEIIDYSSYRNEKRQKIVHSSFLLIEEDGTPYCFNLWCWSKNK